MAENKREAIKLFQAHNPDDHKNEIYLRWIDLWNKNQNLVAPKGEEEYGIM